MKVGTQKRSARPAPLSCNQHPVLSGPVRGAVEDQLEQLKRHLLQPILAKLGDTPLVQEVLWAANEAAALAWCTVCPVLVLPALLDEKVADALSKWRKQQKLRGEPGNRVTRPEPRYLCEAA
jgi:hypothetical protein